MMKAARPTRPLRVAILQNSVLHYRLPFYDAIAGKPEIDLRVYGGYLKGRKDMPAWFREMSETLSLVPGIDWQPCAPTLNLEDLDLLVLGASIRTLSNFVLVAHARAMGVPVLWWGQYHSAGSTARAKYLRRAMYRLGSAVLFYTDAEVEAYAADGGTLPAAALNNGIDTREIVTLRADTVPADRPRRALFLGRLTGKARFDVLLQALARPEAQGVELSVIGAADDAVRARAAALGVGDRVLWHGALFSEAEIAPIANATRIFVYPGAVGLSIIHAMAYGLPVLVHDDRDRHMPEISAFTEGETGTTFRYDDPADLARRLAAMIEDSDALARQAAAARSRVAKQFNTDAMAARFTDWARQVAEERQP